MTNTTAVPRIFLRKSKNKLGERCFIGNTPKDKKEVIAILNDEVAQRCGVRKEGVYECVLVPMKKADGFIITDAKWAIDSVSLVHIDHRVEVHINEVVASLRDGKKSYPLVFDCTFYFEPSRIAANIRKKLSYLQLDTFLNIDQFVSDFLVACNLAEKQFKKSIKNEPKKTILVRNS